MRRHKKSVEERFLAKVSPEPNSGCWLWTGALNADRYGLMYYANRRPKMTHRISYEMYVGPIPDGLEIDHLCRNRLCCNPAHLEVVSHQENIKRSPMIGVTSGRLQKAKTHCKQGHSLENAYRRKNGSRQCRGCAAEYYRHNRDKIRTKRRKVNAT
jgi:hypothetical protein